MDEKKSDSSFMNPVYEHFDSAQLRQSSLLREDEIQIQDNSEMFQMEENFAWLDELLEDSETPIIIGAHRRSSSDSVTYLNGSQFHSNYLHNVAQQRSMISMPLWKPHHECNVDNDAVWMPNVNMQRFSNNFGTTIGKNIHLWPSSEISRENDALQSDTCRKLDQKEAHEDLKIGSEENGVFELRHAQSGINSKRAKQQFAQRSRVRKLQYIAELENNVQALQAQRLKFYVELELVNRQNHILSLENNFIRQRLRNLWKEHHVKLFRQDVLLREFLHFQELHQQQQQQQQQQLLTQLSCSHGHINSTWEINSQSADISLNNKDIESHRTNDRSPI